MKTHVWKRVSRPMDDGVVARFADCCWWYRCERCDVPALAPRAEGEAAPEVPTNPEWQYGCVLFGLPLEDFQAEVDWQDCDACLTAREQATSRGGRS